MQVTPEMQEAVRLWLDIRANEDVGIDIAELCRVVLTSVPTTDPIRALFAEHAAMLDANPYCYFELAYTRRTDWMAWICSKPREDDPDRKVLACGQGDTPDEACRNALEAMESKS
jgi:hypothetical protein